MSETVFAGMKIRVAEPDDMVRARLFGMRIPVEGMVVYQYRGDVYFVEVNDADAGSD